jgi:hypothetical protein
MLINALNRTLLLMGAALKPECTLQNRLNALTSTRVMICADQKALETAAGQTALVTASMLMARSGHDVWLDVPRIEMIGPQPPLQGTNLLDSLIELGRDLLPDREIHLGVPPDNVDLVVLIGQTTWSGHAGQIVALNAGDGWATLDSVATAWSAGRQPFGAMAAGAMAAAEAFKSAMRRLREHAKSPEHFDEEFAPSTACKVVLAPEGPLFSGSLPPADIISGGAIGNALAFALLRVPTIEGVLGILDDDRNDLTNLNRNAMLRRSQLCEYKVESLAVHAVGAVRFQPRAVRYEPGVELAPTVLIGVDHIPSRWAAQATDPGWMGVGATTGFCVQVSEHAVGRACAGCLHPIASTVSGAIPTVAFVSFWAGLLLVVRWLRYLSSAPDPYQQTFFSPLRPEAWTYGGLGVAIHPECPVGCTATIQPANVTVSEQEKREPPLLAFVLSPLNQGF